MNVIELGQKLQYIFGAVREDAEREMKKVVEAFELFRETEANLRKSAQSAIDDVNKLRGEIAQIENIMTGGCVLDSDEVLAPAAFTRAATMVKDLVIERNTLRRELAELASAGRRAENIDALKAMNQDHARTIQMLRKRCTEHTRRELQLEDKIRNVVDEASKIAAPLRERGKKIDQLQKLTERLRKRGNTLASIANQHKKDYTDACETIVLMHEAATGRQGMAPRRGVVEDMADVRKEGAIAVACLEKTVKAIERRRAEFGRHDSPGAIMLRDVLTDISAIIDAEGGKTAKAPDGPSGWTTEVKWTPTAPEPKRCKEISPGGNPCINDAGPSHGSGARLTQEQIDYINMMIVAAIERWKELAIELTDEEWAKIDDMIKARIAGAMAVTPARQPGGRCKWCSSVLAPTGHCSQGCGVGR